MAKTFNHRPGLLTIEEAAIYCGVAPAAISEWIKKEKLPSEPFPDGSIGVAVQDLTAFPTARLDSKHDRLSDAMNFLIVDDDAEFREVLASGLRMTWKDARIEEVKSGFEASQMITRFHPNVILLDINLPGADGMDVCSLIRQNPRLAQTVIICMSGLAHSQTRQMVLERGADAFLTKPVSKKTLHQLVKKLLASRKRIP
ncbi:MAG: hypothetical protein COB53_03360 [Elusimicrobia bacterium]|nr:MAG: hypothetical protein COB53_03360 [Elusimicrobiota bacterium]